MIGGELSETDSRAWSKMIEDVDVNGDGQIDFDEFMKMMYTLKEANKYA